LHACTAASGISGLNAFAQARPCFRKARCLYKQAKAFCGVSEAYLTQLRDSNALKALFHIDLSPCSRCNAQHPAYLPNTQNL